MFDKSVGFLGKYRPYQQRVLNNIDGFLDNQKIHIVAAPGSGKTTLGLELILRLNNASLVLVPSIAIREQWIYRFTNSFLKDVNDKDKWISNDIKNPRPIICITYQALYSAFKKEVNNEGIDEESDDEKENNDYKGFDLFKALEEYKIQTICLDECHHLKNEWWKVLEAIVKMIDDCKIIALTATPPYDSTVNEWQKYINLCGPIDEEIFVPELIKDHNLCPHQDYVYFSYPTKQEEEVILKSYGNGLKVFNKYKNNKELVEIVKSNKIYLDYTNFKKNYYDEEDYYKALILFLHYNKVEIPMKIKLLVHMEAFNIKHLEILLQNVLFDDTSSYTDSKLLLSMKKEFSALGVVHSRKVFLAHNEKINKIIAMSLSKLESIYKIVSKESEDKEMKCLILTDYIKMKTKNYIGNEEKPIDSFGTIPIFEYLRRKHMENVTLCCVSGSICIIPKNCIQYLDDNFEYQNLPDENYVELVIENNNRKKLVPSITRLLEKGYINVLIGTKSLLGEGWDSPCTNTLIMASFIGSYVLSNQMRGRAIRTDKNNPDKISNVWHLVCLDPFDYNYSYDYYNLQKRFKTFVGVNVKKKTIANGIERTGLPRIPYNEYEANQVNEYSMKTCLNKKQVKDTWFDCINRAKSLETLTRFTIVPRKRLKKSWSFYASFLNLILSIYLFFINNNFYRSLIHHFNSIVIPTIIFWILEAVFIFAVFLCGLRTILLINPEAKFNTLGRAVVRSLKKTNQIHSKNVMVRTTRMNQNTAIYLINASTYEQNIFSDCMKQLLSPVNQPRYLIGKPKNFTKYEYYIVPDPFKKNKELVEIFKKELKKPLGILAIIFGKNDYGKNQVVRASKIYSMKFKKCEVTTKIGLLTYKKPKEKNVTK